MKRGNDLESKRILKVLENITEPLETKEIEDFLKDITRTKIFYRLNNLRAEQKVKGKQVGSGKGTWIWWLK